MMQIPQQKHFRQILRKLPLLLILLAGVCSGCRADAAKRGNMIFETIVVGQLGVNCFIMADEVTKEGIVVDPGGDAASIIATLKAKAIKTLYILNTHGHFDHIGANKRLVEATGAKLMIHKDDEPFLGRAAHSAVMYGLTADNSPVPAAHLKDGQKIAFGRHELKVIHTPGHSPGGVCLYLAEEKMLISGDALFAESIGRTDLPGGSQEQLVNAIRTKLLTLPAETRVYPGHGPATTIGHEKKYNPYLGGVTFMLENKTVILGVTGGIAAYKAVELLRLLVKSGATVHVIMTKGATEFVTPLTFQTLSGNPVHLDLFNLISEQEIGHISLADRADLFIIAPATANVIGKLANGIADDLLTTTVMATRAPVLIAPAMNVNMYENPFYRENEEKLRKHGYLFADPITGELACGWEAKGKMQDPAVIVEEASKALSNQYLKDVSLLVTAGTTREELDPVRFISNHSSGKMGYAIARVARRRGARVILISGPSCLMAPFGVEFIAVESAEQMHAAVMQFSTECDVIIKAAAVADYRPLLRAGQKMKKSSDTMNIELVKNPDILAELGRRKRQGQMLVGFAAETFNITENAAAKLASKNLDMIVANDVSLPGAGFDTDTNRVSIIYRDGRGEELPLMSKEAVAEAILQRVAVVISTESV